LIIPLQGLVSNNSWPSERIDNIHICLLGL
jgi:hypothetical protein